MSNSNKTEHTHADTLDQSTQQGLHEIPLRHAEIGRGTVIKRALPSRYKRMIGAWCFLDHAGPVTFKQGEGLDVGPHPHIGLQTFTWMIEGSVMHGDSLGNAQLIRPKQVNLMTAGYGISHTETSPETETKMHSVQLWIALPDDKKDMPPQFEHYPELPVVEQDQIEFTILVGEFLGKSSPVQVYTELLGVDFVTQVDSKTTLPLNPNFEYGVLVLQGTANINGHQIDDQHLLWIEPGMTALHLVLAADSRVVLIGGVPFESPILLWWNFVGRTHEEMVIAHQQWGDHDPRFGEEGVGSRLSAPPLPDKMRASK